MSDIDKQKDYWNKEAVSFDAIYSHKKGWFQNFLDRIFRWDMYERYMYTLKKSEPIEGKTFLDVGCGSGVYSLELAGRGAKKVIGLDIAENMVEMCRTRAINAGFSDNTTFIKSDLLAYNPDDKIDITIGIGLFDYISEPLPVLARMCQCSKEKVIVSFPRAWTWRAAVRKLRLWLKGCSVYFYARRRLLSLLDAAGFTRYEIKKIGQLYCVTAYPN